MQKHDKFRWVYAFLDLWLNVSPFLLLGGRKSLMNARIGEAGVLMPGGLVALWVACLNHPLQDLMQAGAGLTLGSSMIAAPLALGLGESSMAVWNAQVSGSVFVLGAVLELYCHWVGHNAQ
ncbi:hypothetical protein [Leisingera methylohalidivorans]|uniref:Uncharacterized protein n=1 Tax=Leisingera methylohalidivorans DSM 14336 TaxID=999552 RepID=V9VWZ6_9RHOB|nr:hypothetical protein [Leisingera methylohalidivorans]AHD03256.1 hypothetical protein METH_17710 [Leisingera methylohalidivorans DSM 14336]